MKKLLRIFMMSMISVSFYVGAAQAAVADLQDLGLGPASFWNGSDLSGSFTSDGAQFLNTYIEEYMSWEGFAASTMNDQETRGFMNQYSARADLLADGLQAYTVAYDGFSSDPTIVLPAASDVEGVYVTNTVYAYWSMKEGDAFAKQFGGETGDDPDWFKLTFTGYDAAGLQTGAVEFYLADYRFDDNSQDYIVQDWTYVDLASLGKAKEVKLAFDSSDIGDFGMNTPAYAALDDFAYDFGEAGSGGGCAMDPNADFTWELILFLLAGLALPVLRRNRWA